MASLGLQETFSSTIILGIDNTQEIFPLQYFLMKLAPVFLLYAWDSCCSCWFLILSYGVVNRTLLQICGMLYLPVPVEGGIVDLCKWIL